MSLLESAPTTKAKTTFSILCFLMALPGAIFAQNTHGTFTKSPTQFEQVDTWASPDLGSRAADEVKENWGLNGGTPMSSSNIFNAIAADDNGNLYVIGTIEGNAQFGSINVSSASGQTAMVIGKINPNGQWAWVRAATGGPSSGLDLTIRNNEIAIVGQFRSSITFGGKTGSSNVTNQEEGFVAKMDLNGNISWINVINGAGTQNTEFVEFGSDGSIYIAGEFFNNVILGNDVYQRRGSGEKDMYVAKLSNTGSWTWSADFGSTGRDFLDNMAISANDELILCGSFTERMTLSDGNDFSSVHSNHMDAYIVLMNSQGAFSGYGGFSGDEDIRAEAVAFNSAGFAFIAINFKDNVYFFGTEYGSVGGDWGYLMVSLAPNNQMDAFFSSEEDEFVESIAINKDGDMYFAGGELESGSFGGCDINLRKVEWISQTQFTLRSNRVGSASGSWDQAEMVYVDNKDNVYITGEHEDKLYFGGETFNSSARQMALVLAFTDKSATNPGDTTTSIVETTAGQMLKVFPNPANGQLHVQTSGDSFEAFDAQIRGVDGRQYEIEILAEPSSTERVINTTHLDPGVYFLHVEGTAIRFAVTH
ncbi:T9SS type A sorting domain-containing protein [bacterium SCSIO 12741]|nr:T9SS type A sorting domain-containing protein [bacterium SCSIO 12741]